MVTTLYLWDNNIGDEGAKAIAEALKGSMVTTLYLWDNNIDPEGAKAIAEALKGSMVTTLYLWDNNIGDEGAKAIAEALKGSNVTTLNLLNNNIGDEGAKAIAEALKGSMVTTLDLGVNNIGDEGAKAIAEALKDSMVTTLDLWDNNIGPEGAKAIAEVLKGSMVTTLDLRWNNIGDEGAKAIAKALKGSMVTTLKLWSNSIGPEGAKAIAKALKGSMVTTLDLRWNNIDSSLEREIQNAVMQNRYRLYHDHKKYGEILFHLKESCELPDGSIRPGLPSDALSLIGDNISPVTPNFNLHQRQQVGWEAVMLKGCEFVLMSELPENEPLKPNKLYVQLNGRVIEYKMLSSDGSAIEGEISNESPDVDYFTPPETLDLSDLAFKETVFNIITERGHIQHNKTKQQPDVRKRKLSPQDGDEKEAVKKQKVDNATNKRKGTQNAETPPAKRQKPTPFVP